MEFADEANIMVKKTGQKLSVLLRTFQTFKARFYMDALRSRKRFRAMSKSKMRK